MHGDSHRPSSHATLHHDRRTSEREAVIFTVALILFIPLSCLPFAGHELFEHWQDKYLVPGTEGVLLDIHYLQTEEHIVEEMLRLLEIRNGDILYDLGCGDGRIVIQAAKKPGVRGVGVDIDPRRIAESTANASAANVADRTTFLQQNLFESDIRRASAVTLFLLDEINLRLRPKLFRELRPGTRIVSHNFRMGDWEADKKVSLGLRLDGFHNLYFWVIPANVSGLWEGRHKGETWSLSVRQRFQRINGTLTINGKIALPLLEPTITGDVIRFSVRDENPGRALTFEGKVKGDVMEGLFRRIATGETRWRATRDPATASAIDPRS